MRVLVTGGAGYVGSEAAWQLANAGHDVWIYDDLSRGHTESVGGLPLIRGSLENNEALETALVDHRIEAVMHFAAYALVAESVADPGLYYRNNILGSVALLDAMRAASVTQIVFSSSCATYGHPSEVPIVEDSNQAPVNPYGFSKLAIEQALSDYSTAYGLSFVSLRYFNAAGAAADGTRGEDHDPETHAIPIALQAALGKRDRFTIFGDDYPTPDGTCIRDYIHITDLADAHERALLHLGSGDSLFLNLGTGRGYSVREVVDAARLVTGVPIETAIGARRPGDPPELVADPSRAHARLGWQPKFLEIHDIIDSAWNWHSAHPDGYGTS